MCSKEDEVQSWWYFEGLNDSGKYYSNRDVGDFYSHGNRIAAISNKIQVIGGDNAYFQYYLGGDRGGFSRIQNSNSEHSSLFASRYAKWLPRQDQLQSMLDSNSVRSLISSLNYHELSDVIFNTLEKRWLAIVMMDRCGKEWDVSTKDWIVSDDGCF